MICEEVTIGIISWCSHEKNSKRKIGSLVQRLVLIRVFRTSLVLVVEHIGLFSWITTRLLPAVPSHKYNYKYINSLTLFSVIILKNY